MYSKHRYFAVETIITLLCTHGCADIELAEDSDSDDTEQFGEKDLAISPEKAGADSPRELTVMTQNLFLGSHLEAVTAAETLPELFQGVETDLATVLATDVPGRMKAVAREAALVRPDFIALQEAVIIRVGPRIDQAPAEKVLLDYADLVVRELRAQGLHYHPVAVFDGADAELPAGFPPTKDVRFTDRDVLLARTGAETADIIITNSANGKYAAQASIQTIVGPIETSAGWALADVKVRGQQIRIIGTHFVQPEFAAIQELQATELITTGPANTKLPVIILGDLNSLPTGPPPTNSYVQLRQAGFDDSWLAAHPALPGPTCCQAGDLLNPISTLSFRIDYVLSRKGFTTLSAEIIGDEVTDKTPSGLWPSDHAGVVATLTLP